MKCPQCGSKNVGPMPNDEGITTYSRCGDCGAEWKSG